MGCKVIRLMLVTATSHSEIYQVVVHRVVFTLVDRTMIQHSVVLIGMENIRAVVGKSNRCIRYQTNKAATKSSKSSKKTIHQPTKVVKCQGSDHKARSLSLKTQRPTTCRQSPTSARQAECKATLTSSIRCSKYNKGA